MIDNYDTLQGKTTPCNEKEEPTEECWCYVAIESICQNNEAPCDS